MWATAEESREPIVGFYHRAWELSAATINTLALHAIGHASWWPPERSEVTLHRILVQRDRRTHRHAGNADILRSSSTGGPI